MNEPTEREKQIAQLAHEVAEHIKAMRRSPENEHPDIYDANHDSAMSKLAAITAANQQRNEDTARLVEASRKAKHALGFVGNSLGLVPEYEALDEALKPFDAARGVQPAAKPDSSDPATWGMDHREQFEALVEQNDSAAKQEDAPAAEQLREAFELLHAISDSGRFPLKLVGRLDNWCDHHRPPTYGGLLAAPSPAQEKPVEASAEKTPLQTAARMLRQALLLIEAEDDYQNGNTLPSLAASPSEDTKRLVNPSFVAVMEQELQNNARKGDWRTWSPERFDANSELKHHVAKLVNAVRREEVTEFAADVANIAMKIAECHGSIDAAMSSPSVTPEQTEGGQNS